MDLDTTVVANRALNLIVPAGLVKVYDVRAQDRGGFQNLPYIRNHWSFQVGFLFSRKAFRPSMASSVFMRRSR